MTYLRAARSFFRWRIALAVLALTVIILLIGTVVVGWDFAGSQLPITASWARFWLAFNGGLALGGMVSVYRNLWRYQEQWTWQEVNYSRGVFIFLLGTMIAYWSRLIHHPSVSVGTPLLSIGLMMIIYATAGSPLRFEHEAPKQKEDNGGTRGSD